MSQFIQTSLVVRLHLKNGSPAWLWCGSGFISLRMPWFLNKGACAGSCHIRHIKIKNGGYLS
ncbi:hypothetical protein AO401_23440 [Salmonella enterica]|nr:hypothetical protein [Salmonella enterica]